jgi:hypothetical protein
MLIQAKEALLENGIRIRKSAGKLQVIFNYKTGIKTPSG